MSLGRGHCAEHCSAHDYSSAGPRSAWYQFGDKPERCAKDPEGHATQFARREVTSQTSRVAGQTSCWLTATSTPDRVVPLDPDHVARGGGDADLSAAWRAHR